MQTPHATETTSVTDAGDIVTAQSTESTSVTGASVTKVNITRGRNPRKKQKKSCSDFVFYK